MRITLSVTRDTLNPSLRAAVRAARNKRPIHEAMGLAVVSLAIRSFTEPNLRPARWPERKAVAVTELGTTKAGRTSFARSRATTQNAHPLLQLSTALRKSLRVVNATARGAAVGSDRKYAAIHQLGGTTREHIIRPRHKKALSWPGGAHPMKKVNHPGSKIPPRAFFPFDRQGNLTAEGRKRVEAAVRGKLGLGRP